MDFKEKYDDCIAGSLILNWMDQVANFDFASKGSKLIVAITLTRSTRDPLVV